jgi:O-antigen/teichoic acid export membrane protein
MAAQRLDIVLVGALRGPVDAALYTAATRFLAVGQAAGLAISMPAQAALGEVLARDDRAAANGLYRAATAWLVVVVWPFYLVMLFGAPLVLALFGPGYAVGVPVMVVLSLTMLVATACGMVDTVLTMAGRTTWSLYDMLAALGVQIAVDLLLIPRLGVLGAALGWAAAILVKNLAALVQIRFWAGLHPFDRGTLTACALAGGCFGAVPALFLAALGRSTGVLLAALAVGGVAYGAGLWRLRWVLRLDDLPLLRRVRPGVRASTPE